MLLFQTIPCSPKVNKRNNPMSAGEVEEETYVHIHMKKQIKNRLNGKVKEKVVEIEQSALSISKYMQQYISLEAG